MLYIYWLELKKFTYLVITHDCQLNYTNLSYSAGHVNTSADVTIKRMSFSNAFNIDFTNNKMFHNSKFVL